MSDKEVPEVGTEVNYQAIEEYFDGGVVEYHYMLTSGANTALEVFKAFGSSLSEEEAAALKDSAIYKQAIIDEIAEAFLSEVSSESPGGTKGAVVRIK